MKLNINFHQCYNIGEQKSSLWTYYIQFMNLNCEIRNDIKRHYIFFSTVCVWSSGNNLQPCHGNYTLNLISFSNFKFKLNPWNLKIWLGWAFYMYCDLSYCHFMKWSYTSEFFLIQFISHRGETTSWFGWLISPSRSTIQFSSKFESNNALAQTHRLWCHVVSCGQHQLHLGLHAVCLSLHCSWYDLFFAFCIKLALIMAPKEVKSVSDIKNFKLIIAETKKE